MKDLLIERLLENAGSETLHLNVGYYCNNSCVFCMEDNRKGRYETLKDLSIPDVVGMVRDQLHKNLKEVCLTCGEPSINPNLPEFIRQIRELGDFTVSMQTNGRMCSYMPFATKLVKSGMDLINVSIHGHTKKLHEGLTRTPGSFEQSMQGLKNLVQIQKATKKKFKVRVATVLNKRNLPHVKEMTKWFLDHGADQHILNVIQPIGRGDTLFNRLVPGYREAAKGFGQAIRELEAEGELPTPIQAFLVDIPYCTTEDVPSFNRGFPEKRMTYADLLDFNYIDKMRQKVESRLVDATENIERQGKTFVKSCVDCRYVDLCEGIWTMYLDKAGPDEFVPVPRPSEEEAAELQARFAEAEAAAGVK